MSRRSRRREGVRQNGWLGRIAITFLAVAVVFFGGGYLMLRSYLHSDGFRKFLSGQVSRAADVKGEFSAFRWDGLAVDTEVFEASGEGPLVSLRADGLHTEVGFGGVKRGVWELNGTSVRRLEAFIDAERKFEKKTKEEVRTPVVKKERPKPWYPSEVEVKGFDVREANIEAVLTDDRRLSARGLSLRAEAGKRKGNYDVTIDAGRLTVPGELFPEMVIDRVRSRFQDGTLFVTSARASVWDTGSIDATGEWNLDEKTYSFEGNADGIPCDRLVSESWAKRLTGTVATDFTAYGRPGESVAQGSLVVANAVVTALPVLDALAAYSDTRRFRVLELNEARADWNWKRNETSLTNIILASDGLVRLEGNLTIRGRELDGIFRLGLAQGVLANIPGAESDVFTTGEKGLLWTTLRISGTVDDPKEDLTDRLITAAGVRMFEELPGGEKVLKFSRSLLGGDTPEETIRRGLNAIEQGEDVVREAKDLLEANKDIFKGIFGGGEKSKDTD